MLCFVKINSDLSNHLCVWVNFHTNVPQQGLFCVLQAPGDAVFDCLGLICWISASVLGGTRLLGYCTLHGVKVFYHLSAASDSESWVDVLLVLRG